MLRLSLLLLVAAAGHDIPAGVQLESMCPSGTCESEESLSLRQLRATSKDIDVRLKEEVFSPNTTQGSGAAVPVLQTGNDDCDGLPGGWGEAENETEQEKETLEYAEQCLKKQRRRHRLRRHRRHHHGGRVITVYHQTGMRAGPLILKLGFRPGRQGWCGGGIYFALSPRATQGKAIGPDSHKGFMIQARVNVGRVKYYPRTHVRSRVCDRRMTRGKLRSMGYDSIRFNPGDGDEVVIYDSSRVISMKRI
eukprot:TRINITY_DN6531_c0_g1_i1.p1 TRINITY_DN6531_c0_g1~~TRINITY_DN6531_c0_g1_i1.p1  ORF type:complete len:250 (-),score=34.87 TRINITY_DN6531_c0_g1_i1:207-956(-)